MEENAMAQEITKTSGTSHDAARRPRGALRFMMRLGQLAAVFVLGVLVGARHVHLVKLLPSWITLSADQSRQTSSTRMQRDLALARDGGPREVDRLLSDLDSHLRRLLAEREQLEAAAKEDRIAYSLLRGRGYSDDSPECLRLVNRQKQIEAAALQHHQIISDAKQLQRRLCDMLDAAGSANPEAGLPAQLAADVRRCLSRSRVESPTGYEIPNERWDGGPDALMNPDQIEKRAENIARSHR